eukprot:TRINITY_DN48584_c0_g1_i1.p1 TRINITY_DN48584_c0_g1~~TRINITY_DN48584_c0_g1_i1.p1  ORF type:complete len:1561 (-),score=316.48 TRINITY_DN48584_c0_g1_i1:128-4810(-)
MAFRSFNSSSSVQHQRVGTAAGVSTRTAAAAEAVASRSAQSGLARRPISPTTSPLGVRGGASHTAAALGSAAGQSNAGASPPSTSSPAGGSSRLTGTPTSAAGGRALRQFRTTPSSSAGASGPGSASANAASGTAEAMLMLLRGSRSAQELRGGGGNQEGASKDAAGPGASPSDADGGGRSPKAGTRGGLLGSPQQRLGRISGLPSGGGLGQSTSQSGLPAGSSAQGAGAAASLGEQGVQERVDHLRNMAAEVKAALAASTSGHRSASALTSASAVSGATAAGSPLLGRARTPIGRAPQTPGSPKPAPSPGSSCRREGTPMAAKRDAMREATPPQLGRAVSSTAIPPPWSSPASRGGSSIGAAVGGGSATVPPSGSPIGSGKTYGTTSLGNSAVTEAARPDAAMVGSPGAMLAGLRGDAPQLVGSPAPLRENSPLPSRPPSAHGHPGPSGSPGGSVVAYPPSSGAAVLTGSRTASKQSVVAAPAGASVHVVPPAVGSVTTIASASGSSNVAAQPVFSPPLGPVGSPLTADRRVASVRRVPSVGGSPVMSPAVAPSGVMPLVSSQSPPAASTPVVANSISSVAAAASAAIASSAAATAVRQPLATSGSGVWTNGGGSANFISSFISSGRWQSSSNEAAATGGMPPPPASSAGSGATVPQQPGSWKNAYPSSHRVRDDEIIRLKEHARIASQGPGWTFSPGSSPGRRLSRSTRDACYRRLIEENSKLQYYARQLQDALKNGGVGADALLAANGLADLLKSSWTEDLAALSDRTASTVDRATPKDAALAHVAFLERENAALQEELERYREAAASTGEEDRRSLEDMLHKAQAEISRLASQNAQLQEQLTGADDEAGKAGEDGERKTPPVPGVRTQKEKLADGKRQSGSMQQLLAAAQRDRQKLMEESRQRFEQLRSERERWRQEREAMLQEQRRREKTEETLRRQNAALQERLDRCAVLQLSETEQNSERRRQSLGGSSASDSRRDSRNNSVEDIETIEVDPRNRAQELESQIHTQSLELARLRREMQQVEAERADACAQLLAQKQATVASSSSTSGGPGLPVSSDLGLSAQASAPQLPPQLSSAGAGARGVAAGIAAAKSRAAAGTAPPPNFGRPRRVAEKGPPPAAPERQRGVPASRTALPARSHVALPFSGTGGSSSSTPPPPAGGSSLGISAGGPHGWGGGGSMQAPAGSSRPVVPSLDLGGGVHTGDGSKPGGPTFVLWGRNAIGSDASSDDDASSAGSSSPASSARRRRHSIGAVFGDKKLTRIPDLGWYFRLRINSGCMNWVGGFAIGVTLSSPYTVIPLPDRAARVGRSWLAGYWGRTFANGKERLSRWSPKDLQAGDEVAFLVNPQGICAVFVNEQEVCRFADPPVPVSTPGGGDLELYPLIDISSAATTVTFLDNGLIPSAVLLAANCNSTPELVTQPASPKGSASGAVALAGTPGGASADTPAKSTALSNSPPPPPPSPWKDVVAAGSPARTPPTAGSLAAPSTGLKTPPLGASAPPYPGAPALAPLSGPAFVTTSVGTFAGSVSSGGPLSSVAAAVAAAVRRVPALPLPIR